MGKLVNYVEIIPHDFLYYRWRRKLQGEKEMSKVGIVIFLLVGLSAGGDCYDSQKLWLVIRSGGHAEIFETKKEWVERGGKLEQLYAPDLRWFARNSDTVLADWQLLEAAGLTRLARDLREKQERWRRRSTIQLILGVPLGLAMLGGGIYWGRDLWQREKPSTVDMAGSVVLSFAGLGVILSSISEYKKHHSPPDITQHYISIRQAVDIVDKYNTSLKLKCSNRD